MQPFIQSIKIFCSTGHGHPEGKIIAIGFNVDILKEYDADEMLDAGGKFIYPGFIDAHCLFTGYATDMWKCDVTGTRSFEAIIEVLKK